MPPPAPSFIESTEEMWIGEDAGPGDTMMETESTGKPSSVPDLISTEKILDAMGSEPDVAVGDEISRKQFNRMLLDHVSAIPRFVDLSLLTQLFSATILSTFSR